MCNIIRCYFFTFVKDDRKFSLKRLILYGIIPLAASVAILCKYDAPNTERLSTIIPIYGILIAVLVGVMPLAFSITDRSGSEEKYTTGQSFLARKEIDRIQALQDLSASVSYAITMLVMSLVSCIVLALFQPEAKDGEIINTGKIWPYFSPIIGYLVYWGGVTSIFIFFDIAMNIFEAIDHYSEVLKMSIRRKVK
ncbi:MAG: hypothetical protein CMJ19_22845 [Phycisphaeraceae bacterium]|nr:hypothetical protein [Phycisphaeraceae bacterium]|tara:strand:+ start:192 stop:776 length:585 start_codon:yes stop_codon:yes gene_type:complete